jgi:AraC-like DNA-binding protein
MYGAISGMIDDLLPRDYKKNTQPLDKRIEYIAWYIQHNIQLRHFSLAELARKVELSESGFMHLFTTEIGIPLRKYVQWKRVKSAALEVQRGLSLTNAALAAGFSDLGHFSKVYKSMIGLMPSAVLKQKF